MAPTRSIDILFATHNGARTLPRMLAALRRLEAPRRPWRILAVDNASTDMTAQLLEEARTELPIVPLRCPEPGKMAAIRLGARHVLGDLVLFTDDDVEPVPQWLQAYESAADAQSDVGLFGGPIMPRPMEGVRPWFEASRSHHAELFALSDQPEGPVDAPAYIYGPNFLLRRAHLDVLDDVALSLGPTFAQGKSSTAPMTDDSMLMDQLVRRRIKASYVRGATVAHLVREFQTDLEFMLKRAERHGRGTAIRLVEEKQRSLGRRLAILLRNAPRVFYLPGLAGGPPTPERFADMWEAHWSRGAVKGAALGPFSTSRRA
jgi:glycosyltransferase involved in cell wall biosynthesis